MPRRWVAAGSYLSERNPFPPDWRSGRWKYRALESWRRWIAEASPALLVKARLPTHDQDRFFHRADPSNPTASEWELSRDRSSASSVDRATEVPITPSTRLPRLKSFLSRPTK